MGSGYWSKGQLGSDSHKVEVIFTLYVNVKLEETILKYVTDVQKRVPSSAVDQSGSKVHRWPRASAAARVAKNKLGTVYCYAYFNL